MAQVGRRPRPTRLKVIEGNPGKRKARSEPKPAPVRPSRPEWLSVEAKREWSRIIGELERLGLMTVVDRAALAGYCENWARAVAAETLLKKKGTTFMTPNGYPQQRPEVAIANRAWQQVRSFASEFGLTPAARSRLEVPEMDDEDDRDLD